jgi:wobble nucleotide-excising tRNase
MINRIKLIRNVGRFNSMGAAANIDFCNLTLIYAENGRGKTTLAAIFRSLSTGDPIPIVERRRLGAEHPPCVIIECTGDTSAAVFQNGTWNRKLKDVAIFDDEFVDKNVYSGLVVEGDHRQNLHELILGAQGVELNQRLRNLVAQIEVHNRSIRQCEASIPLSERGALTIDEFCALQDNPNTALEIEAAERRLAAALEQSAVHNAPMFELLTIPSFDLHAIETVLQAGLSEIDAAALASIREHIATSGKNAEVWISEGMRRQAERPKHLANECVFCAQNLEGSAVISHYRTFFSDAYRSLQDSINENQASLVKAHAEQASASLERSIRLLGERRQFWGQFIKLTKIQIDTSLIVRDWQTVRNQLLELFSQKRAAPLDAVTIPDVLRAAVQRHQVNLNELAKLNQQLSQENQEIAAVKQQLTDSNPEAIRADLVRLKTIQARYSTGTSALCANYLAEEQAKAATEILRDKTKEDLEHYRVGVFPTYQAAINRYLELFNAGYQIDEVKAVNTRGGAACTYNVVINNTRVAVTGNDPKLGEHSFKNTLSAGDRNTLALAFFLASIELDGRGTKTVIIDDPVSSLDEHRSLVTVQEIKKLAANVSQVVVLSHSKPFLCQLWKTATNQSRAALHVLRDADGSTIDVWNVNSDSVTEHDKRDEALRVYLTQGGSNNREIATFLRPHVEAFFRVVCPEHFPPETLLGKFRDKCSRRVNTPEQILGQTDVQELGNILEYANRFHHDTNPSWRSEVINATELNGYVRRVLSFVKRR